MMCLQVHVTTSPLATQVQRIGVLVAGAGLRLDADSTLGCTSSIALLAAFTNSIREDEHFERLMLFVSTARSTLSNLYILD